MAGTLESKCIILIVLHLMNNARSTLAEVGNDPFNLYSHQDIPALRWPMGIVTYYVDTDTYDRHAATKIRMAMNVLESSACIQFEAAILKPNGNMTWIHISNSQGLRDCDHEPEYIENNAEIVVVLGYDCLKERDILHTLLHAIGFKDEVTHPQRDNYIRVMWNNIQPEYRYLYRIRSSNEETYKLHVEYDPQSIMHFYDHAFTINGHPTVMPLVPGLVVSPSDKLSQLDKMRLKLLFDHECNKRKVENIKDTCKTLLSNNTRPISSENVTDVKPEDNKGMSDYVDELDKKVEGDEANNVNEVDKADGVDTADRVHKTDEVDKSDGFHKAGFDEENKYKADIVDIDNEVTKLEEIKDQNYRVVKSVKSQKDLKRNPDPLDKNIPKIMKNEIDNKRDSGESILDEKSDEVGKTKLADLNYDQTSDEIEPIELADSSFAEKSDKVENRELAESISVENSDEVDNSELAQSISVENSDEVESTEFAESVSVGSSDEVEGSNENDNLESQKQTDLKLKEIQSQLSEHGLGGVLKEHIEIKLLNQKHNGKESDKSTYAEKLTELQSDLGEHGPSIHSDSTLNRKGKKKVLAKSISAEQPDEVDVLNDNDDLDKSDLNYHRRGIKHRVKQTIHRNRIDLKRKLNEKHKNNKGAKTIRRG